MTEGTRESGIRVLLVPVVPLLGLGLGLVALLYLLPRPAAVAAVSDHGAVDMAGICLYALAVFLYTRQALDPGSGAIRWNLWGAIALLLVLAYLELAQPGWTLGKYFRADAAPPDHLLLRHAVAWGVPLLAGILVIALFVAGRKAFLEDLRTGAAVPWLILAIPGVLGVTWFLDRIQGGMGWPHAGWERYHLDRGAYFAVGVVEESLEFLIPVLFLAILWVRRRSRAAGT